MTSVLWASWLVLRLTVGGVCERPELVQNFDSKRYLGRWYEMYRDETVVGQEADCATATYVLDGTFIEVNNIEYDIEK